jgi:hypothetical protein
MTRSEISQRLQHSISLLNIEQQQRLLEFIDVLITKPKSIEKRNPLLQFAGAIPKQEVEKMEKAIQEGCENIDKNDW